MDCDHKASHILTISLLFILFFASCGKKTQQSDVFVPKNSSPEAKTILLQYAKQPDLPIPIGFTPVVSQIYKAANKTSVCYRGNLNVTQSIEFYKNSMEVYGWQIDDLSVNQEGLLFCKKTNKQCILSIRPAPGQKTDLIITLQKEAQQVAQKNSNEYIDTINTKKVTLT